MLGRGQGLEFDRVWTRYHSEQSFYETSMYLLLERFYIDTNISVE